MEITIIQGTPKTSDTASDVYMDFIFKNFTEHNYKIIPVSRKFDRMENDGEYFDAIMNSIKKSDGILWIIPVYFALVPSQVKRFIELIYERGYKEFMAGKHTAVMSTSIRYFDHTMLDYMHAICEDFDMHYYDGFSAPSYPAIFNKDQKAIKNFAACFFEEIKNQSPSPRYFNKQEPMTFVYINDGIKDVPKTENANLVLIHDAKEDDLNLKRMIETFEKNAECKTNMINLNKLDMSPCTGCACCTYDCQCSISDEFEYVYESVIKPADIVILAGSIKDRFLSSQWKMFLDRSFYNNHIDVHRNKQFGIIISGNLRDNANIRTALDGLIQMQHANIVGYVTDEYEDSEQITKLLEQLAQRVVYYNKLQFKKPETFLGIGGDKIFRDFIYIARYPLRASYLHFRKGNFKSFPQKQYRLIMRTTLMLALAKLTKEKRSLYRKYRKKSTQAFRERLGLNESSEAIRKDSVQVLN